MVQTPYFLIEIVIKNVYIDPVDFNLASKLPQHTKLILFVSHPTQLKVLQALKSIVEIKGNIKSLEMLAALHKKGSFRLRNHPTWRSVVHRYHTVLRPFLETVAVKNRIYRPIPFPALPAQEDLSNYVLVVHNFSFNKATATYQMDVANSHIPPLPSHLKGNEDTYWVEQGKPSPPKGRVEYIPREHCLREAELVPFVDCSSSSDPLLGSFSLPVIPRHPGPAVSDAAAPVLIDDDFEIEIDLNA